MLLKKDSELMKRLMALQTRLEARKNTSLTPVLKEFVNANIRAAVSLDWISRSEDVYDAKHRGYFLTVEKSFNEYTLNILNTDFTKSKEISVKGGLPSIGACERVAIAIIAEVEDAR